VSAAVPSPKKERSYLANTVITALFTVGGLSLGLLASSLTARGLGPEAQGRYSILYLVFNLISAHAGLGVARTVMVRVAEHPSEARVLLRRLLLFVGPSAAGVALACGAVFWATGYALEGGGLEPAVFLLAAALGTVADALAGLLRGLRRYVVLESLTAAVRAARVLSVGLLFLLGGLDVFAMGAIQLALVLLNLGLLGRALGQALGEQPSGPAAAAPPPPLARLILPGLAYEAVVFLALIIYRVDQFLLLRLRGEAEVGTYSVAVLLAEQLWFLVATVASIHATEVAARSEADARALTCRVHRLALALTAGAAVGTVLLAEPLVWLLFGEAYAPAVAPLRWLAPGVLLFASFKVLWRDFYGRQRMGLPLLAMIGSFVINLGLNLLWIPSYGPRGAAWASSVAYGVAALVLAEGYRRSNRLPLRALWVLQRADLDRLLAGLRARRARAAAKRG